MEELESAKVELTRLYSATEEPGIGLLEYLRRVVAYAAFLKTSPVLARLIVSVKEERMAESISEMQKSNADPVYRKLVEMREQAPSDEVDTEPVPPLFFLQKLEDALEDFTLLGDAKTEEEFKEKKVLRRLETRDGAGWIQETAAGNTLLVYADYEYPKMLMIFQKQMIIKIDSVLASGSFPTYLGYDSEKGTLYVQGKPVQITKRKSLTNAHYLLEYLFANDPFTKHFYDELEQPGNEALGKTPRVYYGTCEEINTKVEDATGIKEFLDFSSGQNMYVRINPHYAT